MINYSEYLTYDEFKLEILNLMFLKQKASSSRKLIFEDLDTNQTIFNSIPYKTAKILIDSNSSEFQCDLNQVYKGLQDLKPYKINLLNAMYNYIKKNSSDKITTFLEQLRIIFIDIIFNYSKTDILKMYSIDSFSGINSYTINNNSNNNTTKFFWDIKGYAFSKLQINLTTNRNVGVKFLKDKCNFTDNEIKRLTNVDNYTTRYANAITQSKKNSIKKEAESKVNDLSQKLSGYVEKINELELEETEKRINIISDYEYIKKTIFENIKTFIHLIDYDNQYRFSNIAKNEHYLYWHIKKHVESGNPLLTSEFIKDFKLKYTEYGKNNPSNVKQRYNNIENNLKDNGFKNLNILDIKKYVTSQMVLDAITINELSIISETVYINDIVTKYRIVTDDITQLEVAYDKVELIEKKEITVEETDNINQKINEIVDIPDEINEKTPIDKYQTSKLLIILKELLNKFISKHSNKIEVDYTITYRNSLNSLCNSTNDLRKDLNNNVVKLKEYYKNIFASKNIGSSNQFKIIVNNIDNFTTAYEQMTKTEAAATYVIATGKADETQKILLKNNKEIETLANGFLKENGEEVNVNVENNEVTPLTILLSQKEFLYMKELDYRNLEACLRRGVGIKPSEFGCQRIWILIYLILNIAARTNNAYNSKDTKNNSNDFMSNVSSLFNKMRLKKWNHDYSDIEKHFSMLYSFVKYKQNPFTIYMKDKGFNQSQTEAMELRKLLEEKREELIDNIKELVYGKNKIYDIFQGIADLAYELSMPISLYTDFSIVDMGENVINEFLNACVSSLEMQTAMTLYDFLFNFSIEINGKKYTLNSLNNTLKMFNLIVQISKNNQILPSMSKYDKLAEYTTDYQLFQKIGFFTYNRDWNNKFDLASELRDKLTGYYLSDDRLLYDIVEYCRNKGEKCDPGDVKSLSVRINRLQRYEWIAIYAVYLLNTRDKEMSHMVIDDYMDILDLGYLNIKKIVTMLEAESKNVDVGVTYLHPYIEDLGNRIMMNDDEFNEFIYVQKNFLKEFINNLDKNRKILKKDITSRISDEKVIDWMMKMFPSYELIAQAFGFTSLSGIDTLNNFIQNILDCFNLIIKITFDKWKTKTIETMTTRQFQLIEKERYYYLQSFPVIIDWIIKNLETYINACSVKTNFSDPVDIDEFQDNLSRLENLSKDFVIKLKEEIGNLNTLQISKYKKMLLSELVIIEDFNRKDAEMLVEDIFNLDNTKEINLKNIPEEIIPKIFDVLENFIDQF